MPFDKLLSEDNKVMRYFDKSSK